MIKHAGCAVVGAILVWSIAFAPACSDSDDGDDSSGTDSDSDSDTDSYTDIDTDLDHPGVDDIDPATLVGLIRVTEFKQDNAGGGEHGGVAVWGLLDRPFVEGVFGEWSVNWTGEVWHVIAAEGDCFVTVNVGYGDCASQCVEEEYCTPQGDCEIDPVRQDAGSLDFLGLSVPLTLEPSDLGVYTLLEELPADLYQPGSVAAVQASGLDFPAFIAAATGVSPLEPEAPCNLTPQVGQDIQVSWTPTTGEDSAIRFELQAGHHAANGPMIRCETEDTGSLIVPASLVDQYLSYSGEAMQTIVLTRFDRTVVEAEPGETVAFEIGSSRLCLPE